MVTLQQLKAFVQIARGGSFQAAADRLGITQPSVSARIRELEASLGVILFDRGGQAARLNGDGRRLLKCAEDILTRASALSGTLKDNTTFTGTVRLGTSHTFAMTSLADFIRRMNEAHPSVDLELDVDVTNRLSQKLQAGELDMAFLSEQPPGRNVRVEPFSTLPMVWVVSPLVQVPLSPKPSDLADIPILTTSAPSPLANKVVRWFEQEKAIPRRIHRCTSVPIIVDLTIAGLGVSLLPKPVVHRYLNSGELRVIETRQQVTPLRYCVAYCTSPTIPDLSFIGDIARALTRLDPWKSRSSSGFQHDTDLALPRRHQ